MRRFIIILALFSLFFTAKTQENGFKQVDSKEFKKLVETESGVLLDVRTRMEFKNGHIEESGNLNYYALDFKKRLGLLPKDQPIYLYCNTGYRSEKAAEVLIIKGYTRVYNLEHGIMEWELLDYPVKVDPDARPDTDNKMDTKEYYALINSESLVFIDFYAPWCGPCRTMAPMIDSLKVEYHQKINIIKVNADASKKLMKELKIVGVPYLVLFYKGKMLFSKNGAITRKMLTDVFDSNIEKYHSSLAVLKK
jgi:thioredoxin